MSYIIIVLVLVLVLILILLTNKSEYEYYTDDILAPLKKLNLVVSHSNIMIIENNNVLLCETNYELVIYIISAKNGNSINKLNVTDSFEQIINQTDINDIVIIMKKLSEIPKEHFFNNIRAIGGKINIIRKNENYILITNKQRTIYFELASPEPVYYPYIIINKVDCRINPKHILPPKKYILYNNNYYDSDERCAHESNLSHFGLTTTKCTPMTEHEYNQVQQMPRTDECINNVGTNVSMMTYDISKIYSFINNFNNNYVTFYELPNGKGNQTFYKEGIYGYTDFNRTSVNSIYIPADYYLFLIGNLDIIPFYGPLLVNVNEFTNKYYKRIEGIVIQKYKKGNVVVCGMYNKKQICMTFGKGITVLYPKLFIKILYIKMDGDVENVSLFGDISAINLIDSYKNTLENTDKFVKVLYPRIVRSIKVK